MKKELLQQKINNKTKPLGALGLLENLALKIGTIQNTDAPTISKPAMVLFAADHGIAQEGVSLFPAEVTQQMVHNIALGGAAVSVFCRQHGLELSVVDVGVNYDFDSNLPIFHKKIAYGTRNMLHHAAMTMEECESAMKIGADMVTHHTNKGCNCIGFGEMGIANTSSSSLIMSAVLSLPIEQCVGAGAGLAADGLQKKIAILQQVMQAHSPHTPQEILCAFGGLEIAAMCGAMLQAHAASCVIMVDGFISTAALLVAQLIEPSVLQSCVFTHVSHECGHAKMLQFLQAEPLLNLGMRLGEGSGAAVAFPLLKSAVLFVEEMSSFDSAGVTDSNTL